MPKLTRRRVILAKLETTYGVDAQPSADADALLVNMEGSSLSPQGDEVRRNVVWDTFSPLGSVVTSRTVEMAISTELRGGGMSQWGGPRPPDFDALLQSCGMTMTGDDHLGWIYTPKTAAPDEQGSCTIYWYQGGLLHKAVGCRGTWTLRAQVNQIGNIQFTMRGLWVNPEEVAMPTPTIRDLTPPMIAGIGLALGGYVPALNSLELSIGNTVSRRTDINSANGLTGLFVSDRAPSGSVDPEAADLAAFNPWSAWAEAGKAQISATIGTEAGNIIAIDVPKAQYGRPSYGDRDGLLTYQLPFTPTIDSLGDDELKLMFV